MFRKMMFLLLLLPGSALASLDGLWVGYYAYPNGERVPMSVVLYQVGEQFVGEMIEPQMSADVLDIGRRAMVAGSRDGAAVKFDKAYYANIESVNPFKVRNEAALVSYRLILSDDGQELFGKWFVGELSGTASFKRVTPAKVDQIR